MCTQEKNTKDIVGIDLQTNTCKIKSKTFKIVINALIIKSDW